MTLPRSDKAGGKLRDPGCGASESLWDLWPGQGSLLGET